MKLPKEKTAVRAFTPEQAERLLERLNKEHGMGWLAYKASGNTEWKVNKEETVYYVQEGAKGVTWGNVKDAIDAKYRIVEAQELIGKDIVGYKLSKSEYKRAALDISGAVANWENSLERYDISINQTRYIKRLEEAGVLDLWFVPVYEELFTVGDYVTIIGDRNGGWLADYPHNTVVKIVGNPTQYNGGEFFTVQLPTGKKGGLYTDFRKATSEEIEEYLRPILFVTEEGNEVREGNSYWAVNATTKSIWLQTAKERTQLNKGVKAFTNKNNAIEFRKSLLKLPEIKGYEGKDVIAHFTWGCFGIAKSKVRTLIDLDIKSFVIEASDERVEVTEEQFNQIKEYLNNK